MKVSIVVTSFNREKEIFNSISSVLNQTHRDIEVIVVDDASTDGTLKILEDIKDERLIIVSLSKNGGASSARNRGVELAKGDLIMVWDSDDFLYRDAIEKLVKVFKEKEDVVTVSAPARFIKNNSPISNQKNGIEGDVSMIGILCKSQIGSNEKVRLSRSKNMKLIKYGEKHLDFLVNVALGEQGRWFRLSEFLGDVCVGDRKNSLTAARKKRDREASFRRALILKEFLAKYGEVMKLGCSCRLSAYEHGVAWGMFLGGNYKESKEFSRRSLKNNIWNLNGWIVFIVVRVPFIRSVIRIMW